MSDQIGKLLERVAQRAVRYIRIDTETLGHDWDANEWAVAEKSAIGVLERELGPLLRAGQAMRERFGGANWERIRLEAGTCNGAKDWDAALNELTGLAALNGVTGLEGEGADGK